MTKHRTISDFTKEQIIEGLEIKKLFLDDEMSKEDLLDYIYEEDLGGDLDKYGREDLRDILDKEFPLVEPIFTTRPITQKTVCPLCDDHMDYYQFLGTHIWVCTGAGCPSVLFEFKDYTNIKNLSAFLQSRK